jgi:transcriptional regulator with XRE-family HTH domain
MNDQKVRIAARLAEERERLGKTQKEMAAIGDVGDRSYWHYEKGERSPDAECLLNLAAGGVDAYYVLTGNRGVTIASNEEAKLLEAFRRTPEVVRQAVMAALTAGANADPAHDVVQALPEGKSLTPREREALEQKAGIQLRGQSNQKHRRGDK